MAVSTTKSGQKVWQLRDRNAQLIRWFAWFVSIAVIMYCWQVISEKTTWFCVVDAPNIAGGIASRAMPPRWP